MTSEMIFEILCIENVSWDNIKFVITNGHLIWVPDEGSHLMTRSQGLFHCLQTFKIKIKVPKTLFLNVVSWMQ